jgi:hypothetical protein
MIVSDFVGSSGCVTVQDTTKSFTELKVTSQKTRVVLHGAIEMKSD